MINGYLCYNAVVVRTDVRDVSCHLPGVFVKVYGDVLAPWRPCLNTRLETPITRRPNFSGGS